MARYTTDSFIEKATALHGTKYDYIKTIYVASREKITIICTVHGEFQITPNVHIGVLRRGCYLCRMELLRKTPEQFIKECIQIHGSLYDYSKTKYEVNNKKVIVICNIHGEFNITPTSHLQKIGCAKCGTNRTAIANRTSTYKFIERANNIHNGKYIYSNINYINNYTKIKITCPEHGEFMQTPNSHIQGKSGCMKCGRISSGLLLRLTFDEFIKKANLIHHYKYDYSKTIYDKGKILIDIICPEHGTFKQKAETHLIGHGCTSCGHCDKSTASRNTQDEMIERFKKYTENVMIIVKLYIVQCVHISILYVKFTVYFNNFQKGICMVKDVNVVQNNLTIYPKYHKNGSL